MDSDVEEEEDEDEISLLDLNVIDPTDGSWDDELGIMARAYMKRHRSGDGPTDESVSSSVLDIIEKIRGNMIEIANTNREAVNEKRERPFNTPVEILKIRAKRFARETGHDVDVLFESMYNTEIKNRRTHGN
jgi:hypothetical protein